MKGTRLQKEIFRKVLAERARQEKIHGENSLVNENPFGYHNVVILTEETGEVSRALLEHNLSPSFKRQDALAEELIQVAAVIFAWLEAMYEEDA